MAYSFDLANKYFIDGWQYLMKRINLAAGVDKVLKEFVWRSLIRNPECSCMIFCPYQFQSICKMLGQFALVFYFIEVLFVFISDLIDVTL